MNKILIFSAIALAAVGFYFLSSKNYTSEIVSSNVEALVSPTGKESQFSGCGSTYFVEEWIEIHDHNANNLHYTGFAPTGMACNNNVVRCDNDRHGAQQGPHDSSQGKCWHIKDETWYPSGQSWP